MPKDANNCEHGTPKHIACVSCMSNALVNYARATVKRPSTPLANFAQQCAGSDGYLLNQIASFFGGVMDNASINAEARKVGEEYLRKLHELGALNREALHA